MNILLLITIVTGQDCSESEVTCLSEVANVNTMTEFVLLPDVDRCCHAPELARCLTKIAANCPELVIESMVVGADGSHDCKMNGIKSGSCPLGDGTIFAIKVVVIVSVAIFVIALCFYVVKRKQSTNFRIVFMRV